MCTTRTKNTSEHSPLINFHLTAATKVIILQAMLQARAYAHAYIQTYTHTHTNTHSWLKGKIIKFIITFSTCVDVYLALCETTGSNYRTIKTYVRALLRLQWWGFSLAHWDIVSTYRADIINRHWIHRHCNNSLYRSRQVTHSNNA